MNRKDIKAMSAIEAKAFLSMRPLNWRIAWHGRVRHFYSTLALGKGRGRTLCDRRLWPNAFYPYLTRTKKCALCEERYKLIERRARLAEEA